MNICYRCSAGLVSILLSYFSSYITVWWNMVVLSEIEGANQGEVLATFIRELKHAVLSDGE